MIKIIKQSEFKHNDGRYVILKLIQENNFTFNIMSEQIYINYKESEVKRVQQPFAGSLISIAEDKYNKTIDRYLKIGYEIVK